MPLSRQSTLVSMYAMNSNAEIFHMKIQIQKPKTTLSKEEQRNLTAKEKQTRITLLLWINTVTSSFSSLVDTGRERGGRGSG